MSAELSHRSLQAPNPHLIPSFPQPSHFSSLLPFLCHLLELLFPTSLFPLHSSPLVVPFPTLMLPQSFPNIFVLLRITQIYSHVWDWFIGCSTLVCTIHSCPTSRFPSWKSELATWACPWHEFLGILWEEKETRFLMAWIIQIPNFNRSFLFQANIATK